MAGLHRTYVSSVERGKRNISLHNIEKLAEALAVSMAELMPVSEPADSKAQRRSSKSRAQRGLFQGEEGDNTHEGRGLTSRFERELSRKK